MTSCAILLDFRRYVITSLSLTEKKTTSLQPYLLQQRTATIAPKIGTTLKDKDLANTNCIRTQNRFEKGAHLM